MGPKGKRHQTDGKAFLFINEDFDSLFGGSKNPELGRDKQSHVQKQSFVRRKRLQERDPSGKSRTPEHANTKQNLSSPTELAPSTSISGTSTDPPVHQDSTTASDNPWFTSVLNEHGFDWDLARVQQAGSVPATFDAAIEHWTPPNRIQRPDTFRTTAYEPAQSVQSAQDEYTFEYTRRHGNNESMPSIEGNSSYSEASNKTPLLWFPDPFVDVQTALEWWAPPLMRHFATVMVPSLFWTDLDKVPLKDFRNVEGVHADLQSCMTNPAEMYALLATASAHMLFNGGLLELPGVTDQNQSRMPWMFKAKALEALRMRLSLGVLTPGTVVAVHRMVWFSQIEGNYEALEAHYKASLTMINALGGLRIFDNFQQERFIIHDLVQALDTNKPPKMELTWNPGGLPLHWQREMRSSPSFQPRRGELLLRSMDSQLSTINGRLKEVLNQAVEVQHASHWLQDKPYDKDNYHWLMRRRLTITHRCLQMVPRGQVETYSIGAITDDALRLAELIYVLPFLVDKKRIGMVTTIGNTLISRIQSVNDSKASWPLGNEVFLWIVVTAGIVMQLPKMESFPARARQSSIDGATLTITIARTLCQKLGILDIGSLRQFLECFLFSDLAMGEDGFASFAQQVFAK